MAWLWFILFIVSNWLWYCLFVAYRDGVKKAIDEHWEKEHFDE